MRKGAALHACKKYDEAIAAYEAGLAVAPADDGLKRGLDEVKKAQVSSNVKSPFGPNVFGRLAGHPKFGAYLGDPAFVAGLQALTSGGGMANLGGANNDPRLMEVRQSGVTCI